MKCTKDQYQKIERPDFEVVPVKFYAVEKPKLLPIKFYAVEKPKLLIIEF